MPYSTPKLLAAILLCATGLSAQEARGSIGGRVSDTSGAVIANAKITITNTATNEIRRAQTNETGYYEVNFLEPSTYALTFETEGFKKVVRSGVELNVGSKIDISLNLEVGGTTETVEVKGEAVDAVGGIKQHDRSCTLGQRCGDGSGVSGLVSNFAAASGFLPRDTRTTHHWRG